MEGTDLSTWPATVLEMGARLLAAVSLITAIAKAIATATPSVSLSFLFPMTQPVMEANRATLGEGCLLRSVSSYLPKSWQVFRSPEAGAGSAHLGQI